MSRRWLSRFETTASLHLGRMPFFVSALDKDKGKQPRTLSLFSTFLLYLSFIISFLSPASMRNHIFPFLSPNAFPPILHCSTTFFHLPQCLSSVFIFCFSFFFGGSSLRPICLFRFCWPSASLFFPSPHRPLCLMRKMRGKKEIAPWCERCQMSGSLTHCEPTTVCVHVWLTV